MSENTSEWLQFLAQRGARFADSGGPDVIAFDAAQASGADGYVAPLVDLGLIAASGEDAASFLHNQLTNDVERLDLASARLAGYCSPKGRLLATMTIWKSPEAILLQLPREILPAVQKRLQMFVLRAKARLADASDAAVALGIAGDAAGGTLATWFPNLPSAPYAKIDGPSGSLIRMPDADGRPRYQWIATPEAARDAWPALTAALAPAPTSIWRLDDIRAGIPRVTRETQEQFVPQMINFEAVGGVNFKKGCYPGQEIVARSQYLGKLKRRMLPARVEGECPRPGAEVFSDADPDQPCGMIVNAEAVAGGSECLVELKIASLERGAVRLGSPQGAPLAFKPLPYALPDAA